MGPVITVAQTLDALGLGFVLLELEDPEDDESLVFREANESAILLTDLPLRTFAGKRLAAMVPSVAAAGLVRAYAEVARTRQVLRIDHVQLQGEPLAGQSFTVTAIPWDGLRVAVVFDNVTHRIQAAERIRFQSLLLDAVGQGVIAADPEGRVVYANPRAQLLYGRSEQELKEMEANLLSADPSEAEEIRRRTAAGSTFSGEVTGLHRDGRRFPVHLTASPLRDPDGRPMGIVGVTEEISERVRARAALRESEARLRALLAAMPDVVIRLSRRRVIVEASKSKALGGQVVEVGRCLDDLLPSEAAQKMRNAVSRALDSSVLQTIEFDLGEHDERLHFEARILAAGSANVVVIVRDISARRRMELALLSSYDELEQRVRTRTAELREVNEELRALIDASPFAIVSLDREARVRTWNRAAQRIFGWTEKEILGEIYPVVPEENHAGLVERIERIASGEESMRGAERLHLRKDASSVPVRISTAALWNAQGEPSGLIALIEDLTSERAVRAGALRVERHMTVLRTVTDAVHRASDLGELVAVMGERLQSLGIDGFLLALDLRGPDGEERLSWRIQVDAMERLVWDVRTGLTSVRLKPELASRYRSLHAVPVMSRQGVLGCAVFVAEEPDVFDDDLERLVRLIGGEIGLAIENIVLLRHMAEAIERVSDLSRELATIRESERHHIGRELHDQLGQSLTALKFSLETGSRSDSPAASQLRSAARLVSDIIAQVRNVSLSLRAPVLEGGLFNGLGTLFESHRQETGLDVDFTCTGSDLQLSGQLELTVYRVVQEALTNVIRHAGVHTVRVSIEARSEELILCIEDHGSGFDATEARARPTGGLSGMMDRVDLMGGYVRIDSEPGQGTRIEAQLPRKPEVRS